MNGAFCGQGNKRNRLPVRKIMTQYHGELLFENLTSENATEDEIGKLNVVCNILDKVSNSGKPV